jgi:hypothetical protein
MICSSFKKSETAIEKLADKLPDYDYIISERAGRSSSKEQYAIFYNNRTKVISSYDYTPEFQDEFERPPFRAMFMVSNWSFSLYTIHLDPDDVFNELTELESIVGTDPHDVIIIGDLNADGSYYDENDIHHFPTWKWAITNDMDTTVAASDYSYDGMIINAAAENNLLSVGIMDDVTSDQSDHYLIYGIFNTQIQ